ncbi:MAG: biotin--[acetyl-CoA-carboxylase] ligase [Clostridium sp.]|nr:biotin--[acetyl-CoA-carboxylase] ligase [Clostridium sp.]
MTHPLHTLDDSPRFEWIELAETDSTNRFLRHYHPVTPKEMTLVTADFQTDGRGQATNTWESARGANLLFSVLIRPAGVEANRQFVLSQAFALAICESLSAHTDDIRIKWPNDIYWRDSKICGILIENTLLGRHIDTCILGAGVNVNQQTFEGDAPNPVSLRQIVGADTERTFLLADIVDRFKTLLAAIGRGDTAAIEAGYRSRLYRVGGFHSYADDEGTFEATLHDIEPTGHLVLRDRNDRLRRYAFKEVRFVLPDK